MEQDTSRRLQVLKAEKKLGNQNIISRTVPTMDSKGENSLNMKGVFLEEDSRDEFHQQNC